MKKRSFFSWMERYQNTTSTNYYYIIFGQEILQTKMVCDNYFIYLPESLFYFSFSFSLYLYKATNSSISFFHR